MHRFRTSLHHVQRAARRAGFMLSLVWRILRRAPGLVPGIHSRKGTAPTPHTPDLETALEALQSQDCAALAALPASFAAGCDEQGQPWLFHAIDHGTTAALGWFLGQTPGLPCDKTGRSALRAAVERSLLADDYDEAPEDPLAMIAALVAHGADVNAPDPQGRSPLHIAASLGAAPALALLIHSGADPNLTDALGLTPRDHALRAGHTHTAALLAP